MHQSGRDKTGSTVLIVDDHPANIAAISAALSQGEGYRLLSASGGEEAIRLANAEMPDLILLDINMPPGIDGYETIQRLKADDDLQGVPVIFLSSLQETETKVRGLELGAVDYIAKPFQHTEVLARVETHLKIRQLQEELARHNELLEEANSRMKGDLEAAARVQRALLPAALPDAEGYEFGWSSRPCAELGGDSLDIFRINDDTIGFYLLDVSGHGVPASLLAISATRSLAPRADRSSLVTEPGDSPGAFGVASPCEVAHRLNTMYPLDGERNPHFMTMIYGLLDCPTGGVRYTCAGHPRPVVVRADGTPEVFHESDVPIGMLPDHAYREQRLTLAPGDRLYIHCDGCNEQTNAQGEQFGLQRLRATISSSDTPVRATVERVIEQAVQWAGNGDVIDDLSMLGIGRLPA